jgi:predicted secreted protein
MLRNTTARCLLLAAWLLPTLLHAQINPQLAVLPPPQNLMSLSASATLEVPKDWLSVVLSTTREGPDANQVQAQLKAALDAALAEARKLAKPGQVEVRTGGFSMFPKYAPKGGAITGWQGSTELVVEGRDIATLSQLAGRLQTLSIARTGFSLSREAREKVEGDVAAQAITRFRAQAEAYAKQFGFAGYALREVQVNTAGDEGGRPTPMLRMQAQAMSADAALPVEAGKASVTATVSGSVQMTVR